jgi:hypothetical protein
LRPDAINPNRGAESTLAWLLAVERIRGLRSPVGLFDGTSRSDVALSGSG